MPVYWISSLMYITKDHKYAIWKGDILPQRIFENGDSYTSCLRPVDNVYLSWTQPSTCINYIENDGFTKKSTVSDSTPVYTLVEELRSVESDQSPSLRSGWHGHHFLVRLLWTGHHLSIWHNESCDILHLPYIVVDISYLGTYWMLGCITPQS